MRLNGPSFNPSPDAVEEMRAQTNTYDAEYGHSGGAFVNVSTRAGTNALHGTVYWYLRNSALNANNFFNNQAGIPRPKSRENTYGAAAGGPVRLPRLYNGRDRTHYFFDFEGYQIRGISAGEAIIPTALERQGDFSKTVNRSGAPVTIYDPSTTRASGSGFVRSPFSGNIIPASQQDPVAVNVMKFYPVPNRVPSSADINNFTSSNPSASKWASLAGRLDHQISNMQTLFLRYGWNHSDSPGHPFYGTCCVAAGNPNGQETFRRGNIAAGIGYTWVQSARTVFDLRAGFSRYFDGDWLLSAGFDSAQLGFPASFTRAIVSSSFPRFDMSGDISPLGPSRSTNRNTVNQYNLLANGHSLVGRHAVKFGFRWQAGQSNYFVAGRANGDFVFGHAFTQGPDPTRTTLTGGNDAASLLLGMPNSAYADNNASQALQVPYYAFYLQDDWKATDRFTLNLGVRFEHEGPVTDRYNRGAAGFDFNAVSPIASQVQANYLRNPIPELASMAVRGGLGFLNTGGAPRGNLQMPALDYSPRVGFAYRVSNWIVWRGGYGIFYVPNNIGEASHTGTFLQAGFSLATQMTTSLDNNLTPFNRLSNPFPNGLSQPLGAAGGLLTAVGQTLTAGAAPLGSSPPFLPPLSQQFSMGLQFLLPGQISIAPSYVGNVSQRLVMQRNMDQYPNRFLALGTRLNAQASNPFYGVITDATSALSQPTVAVSQLLKPYPQFLGLTLDYVPYGRSHYNSFQLQIDKRTSHGLNFGASYTVSKFMEATAYLNANDARPSSAISSADRPQRLTLYGVYELPMGPGNPFLNTRNPVLRRVVGGWQVHWIITFQSMSPLSFPSGVQRLFKSDKNPHTFTQWFDVTQFAPQEPFTLRTLSLQVADLRSPGMQKWDLTAMKRIPVTERLQMTIQAAFYNAWNSTILGTPNLTVTSSSFGRITSTFLGPREIQLASRISW
jgi:hypothetical protein